MKLLVTGAGGFVGSAVARAGVAAGHPVVATLRPGSKADRLAACGPLLNVVRVDLRDTFGVDALLRDERPDVVVHVAWSGVNNRQRSDQLQITDNIEASCNLLQAGISAGIRKFVGIGSQGEYGPLDGKVSEGDLPEPTSLYGASKLAVLHLTRQLAAQNTVDFAWLRLFASYGPGDNATWLIPSLIEQMLDGTRPKTTKGEQLWDYLYIDDVADGILAAALHSGATGIFNLGSGAPIPVRSVVEAIRDEAAPGMDLVFGEVPYPPNQIWRMEADIAKLTAATGWRPKIDFRTGLSRTVAWHRERRAERFSPLHV